MAYTLEQLQKLGATPIQDGYTLEQLQRMGAKQASTSQITEPQPGFSKNVSEDLASRRENVGGFLQRYAEGKQGLGQTAFQAVGQGAGFIADVAFEGVKSLIPSFISKPIGEQAKKIAETSLGQAGIKAAQQGIEAYQEWKYKNNKNTNTAGQLEAVVNIASLFPVSKGVQLSGKATVGAGGVATKAVGNVASAGAGLSTGTGKGVIDTYFQAIKSGGVRADEAINALRGNTSPDAIVQEAKGALDNLIQQRRTNYTESLSKITPDTTTYDVSPIIKEVKEQLEKFKVSETPEGLDFARSAIRFDKTAQNDISNIVNTMREFGKKSGDRTAVGIDSLKQALGDLYSDSSNVRAFIQAVKSKTRNVLKEVPGYDKMAKDYEESTKLIKEISKGLSLGDKASRDTAFRKLSTTLRTNNEFRRGLVADLDALTGGKLTAQIAGQQLSQILPRGFIGQLEGAGALALIASGAWIPLLKYALFASPRFIGELLNIIGLTARGKNIALQALNKLAGKKIFLPGEKSLKEFEKNPKIGLSIKDVSKSKLHPEDRERIIEFIDKIRLRKGEDVQLEIDARRLAERYKINPNIPNGKLASKLEDLLGRVKK